MDDVKVTSKHGGSKYDGNKAQFGLLPPDALEAVAEVMTKGAEKYSANNWCGLELSRVLNSLERHINKFKSGIDYDADSGQHHLAHAIANTMMAYHIAMNFKNQDDRLFAYMNKSNEDDITNECINILIQEYSDKYRDFIRKYK